MVMLHHYAQYICVNNISDSIFYRALSAQAGFLGVAIFFFLSGFGLMEREQRRETAVSDELMKLGNQVKAQIMALISQGQTEVAGSLLNELKQITPDDGDIVTLEKLCR